MKMEIECLTCFMEQAVRAARLSSSDFREQLNAVKNAVYYISNLDPELTPPEIATSIFASIARDTKNPDAFKELKRQSNIKIKGLMKFINEYLRASEDSFAAAVKISLCGNIIDYGILEDFDVEELIKKEIEEELDVNKVSRFRDIIADSNTISFIADNAGEIGLDGVLLNECRKINPDIDIPVLVKSAPIINDATREDADYFGISKDFKIIEYPDTVGFKIKNMPEDIESIIKNSDYLISKGQANYEILSGSGWKNIVYLLRAKCKVVARDIGVELGSPVIIV